MNFDKLRIDDIICWNEDVIKSKLEAMMEGGLWRHEEFGCLLMVTDYKPGASAKFVCVHDCGLHLTLEMTREQYEDYYDELGTDIFVFADPLTVFGAPVEEADTYDFIKDMALILKKIRNNALPRPRKRKFNV